MDQIRETKQQLEMNQRNVLIIGGAGYIGSVLIEQLLNEGYGVRVLDRLMYENGDSISAYVGRPSFEFVYGDFGNQETLERSLKGITDVVLLAAMVGDPICKKYPELTQAVNVDYPKNLFKTMKGKGISNFVFTSTCSNYGLRKDDSLANETSELNPQSLYAETKIEFEKFILAEAANADFAPTILRISTAFGISRRMRFDLTVSEFTREVASGKDLLVYDQDTWRPYCNVADISKAIRTVLEAPKEKVHGEVFNVGSDENNFTKRMIVDAIVKHIPDANVAYNEGGVDPRNYRVSFDKVKTQLGFVADHSVESAIEELVGAIQNQLFVDVDGRKNFHGNYQVSDFKG